MRFAVWSVAAIALTGAARRLFFSFLECPREERKREVLEGDFFNNEIHLFLKSHKTKRTTGAAVADLFSVTPQVTGDLSALATAAVLGYGAAVERRLLDAEEEEKHRETKN